MFRPVPMVHVQVQVPNRDAPAVTRTIAAEGLLHLVDVAHGQSPGDAAPPGTRELLAAFRDLAHRTRHVAERLDLVLPDIAGALGGAAPPDYEAERNRLQARLAPLERSVEEAWRRAADAHERASVAAEMQGRADLLGRAGVEIRRLADVRFAAVRLGVGRPEDFADLAGRLAPAPFAIVPLESHGPTWLAALAVPGSSRDRLETMLRTVPIEQIALPSNAAAWDPAALEAQVTNARHEETAARAVLAETRTAEAAALVDLLRRAETGVLLLQAQTFFAAAGRFVVVSGWIPAEAVERLRSAIERATGGRALVEIERPELVPEVSAGSLRVPILYRNPLLFRPFQKLVQFYGTPSYTEVEPTAFLAVSFLLMFGLMFGDVGHGLVLFSAGYYLYRYIPRFLDYGILLMEGGTASTLFGFLYGSVFGVEGLLPVLWMAPLRDLSRFMGVAIGLGVALVSLGLILNVVNTWRSGRRASAIFGTRGLFGAFLYWVTLALLTRAFLPGVVRLPDWLLVVLVLVPVGLLALRVPIVRRLEPRSNARGLAAPGTPRWLTALEGSVELVDVLFSYFANAISFVRVAAFAAVHAGAFLAIFALADTLAGFRFGGPLSILTLIAGNVLVIFLEGLIVSVQVLRLEYYEFFGKFFHGGGEPYAPLMLRNAAGKGTS